MANKRNVKCPLCEYKNKNKLKVYEHMEMEHKDQIPDNMGTDQFWYNLTHNVQAGKCVVCKSDTEWNSVTHKYKRFCTNPNCKKIYRETFKKRMIDKYGKETLLNDPAMQKKMLQNRKISGKYVWSDGTEVPYTGSYELKFLEFCDAVFNFPVDDIMSPCPFTFVYSMDDNSSPEKIFFTDEEFEKMSPEEREKFKGFLFYIPDFYIPSLNLIIEIKHGGKNPNTHHKIQAIDMKKDEAKAKLMMKQKKFNFIKITDNQFGKFATLVLEMSTYDIETKNGNIVIIDK